VAKKRRVFTKEFKEQAVHLTETSEKTVGVIAEDLGISENTLWRWKKELRDTGAASFPGQGNRKPGTDLEEKLRKLEQELHTVKMERDILKKAVAIFSQPPK
jgi:transposase